SQRPYPRCKHRAATRPCGRRAEATRRAAIIVAARRAAAGAGPAGARAIGARPSCRGRACARHARAVVAARRASRRTPAGRRDPGRHGQRGIECAVPDARRQRSTQALRRRGARAFRHGHAAGIAAIERTGGTLTGASAPQGFAMPVHVALLLPATGRVAVASAAVRDGFFAAFFHAPVSQEQRPTIKVYDTGGTAGGALSAYQQAVADGASLVVGPLSRGAVGSLFSQASLPVPVLALNYAQGNQPIPAGSAEFALLPEAEGAQLGSHMITSGLHAAIVFRGNDDTSTRTFAAFKLEFESLGGQITNDIVLQPGDVDFASQIQAALAGSGNQTGIVALLRPDQARLLLPQLRLARSTLPVFSTSMVYSGDENATGDGDLDGLQFCDEPWLYDAQ